MTRHLEFLADADSERQLPQNNWQAILAYAKREAMALHDLDAFILRWGRPNKPELVRKLEDNLRKSPLTYVRALFLREQFIEKDPKAPPGQGAHRVRGVEFGQQAMKNAALLPQLPDATQLPRFSAALSLKFHLLTPLLTRDDDPFYLFDNPVRKDHIFGIPYLSAAGIKGLAADAYQRAFPAADWQALGKDDQARSLQYRLHDPHALRLFGIADDGVDTHGSQAGRLHFSPVWFDAVQYLLLNPTDTKTGLGTVPIQFEAIAPNKPDGKPVEAELQLFYFNPGDTESIVRADMARFVASLASWWPALGLGAKRLAGYGAIKPTSATCHANGWTDWKTGHTETGAESWMTLAEHIAEGA